MKGAKHMIWSAIIAVAFGAPIARADDDDEESEHQRDRRAKRRSFATPANPTYKAECGSCHMLYPPGFLPVRSWAKMMGSLTDHFGENATLDKETSDKIQKFLMDNAADRSSLRRSQKIAKSIPSSESPQRITETLYFKRKHHELGRKIWSRKSIVSPANCTACHSRGEQGVFSEDEVRIPR